MTRKPCVFGATILTALGAVLPLNFGGCAGGAGFLGLQDYQRDLIFGIGGGLAGALLDNLIPPPPVGDQAGKGDVGAPGEQGPAGPPLFSVYVDTFYTGEIDVALGVVPQPTADPQIVTGGGPIAFSIAVPNSAIPSQPVMMRFVMFRNGPCLGGCFAFSVNARRAALGTGGAACFGGSAADCSDGARFVLVPDACAGVPASPDVQQFVILDVPLGPNGLDLPAVNAGDLLAFEVGPASSDGGVWHVLGVEFTDAAGDQPRNATSFKTLADAQAACGAGL